MEHKILVVDDEPANRELIHAYLDGSEYRLIDASGGAEALRLFDQEQPDLVLLDLMMPDLNGFEVTRRLREHTSKVFLPIVLVTSLHDMDSRREGLRVGADEFLSKPLHRQELIVRMGNLLKLRDRELDLVAQNTRYAELSRFRDEMSSLLVHDLKNPITAILTNLDLVLQSGALADPWVVEALSDTQHAARRLLDMTKNLLDLTRMEAGRLPLHRERTEVATLCQRLVRPRVLAAGLRNVEIESDVPDGLEVNWDKDLVLRLFENLLDNSLRYTPASGRIRISAALEGIHVRVMIANTGPAIPAAARQVIFEKYAQGGAGVGRMNLGLGLYFCRLASEAHGGRIWVDETAEFPTVFTVELPRR